MDDTALIAIDWGTTSARAYRVSRDGSVLDRRSAPLGVQQVRDGDFAAALASLLGDWQSLAAPRIAAGMIGSRQGWVEAPYLPCPASFDALAGSLARAPGGELLIVPGLTTRDADAIPDVMRGEETQLAGAVADDEPPVVAVLPGTHSKWARVEQGRIVDFRTYLTGELYAVLLGHSILGRLAQPREEGARETTAAFAHGVRRGLAPGDLAHDVFGARTLALAGELAAEDVADWLSGLLIGREIAGARAFAFGASDGGETVRVIGEHALVGRYADALGCAGLAAEPAPPDASVAGLARIARASGLLQ